MDITTFGELRNAFAQLPLDPESEDESTTAISVVLRELGALMQETPADMRFGDVRASLWQWVLLTPVRALCAPIPLSASAKQSTGDESNNYDDAELVTFGELHFLAVTAVLNRHYDALSERTRTRRVQEMNWIRERQLCPIADDLPPIVDYSMAEVIECVQSLRWAFVTAPYHNELVELVELLEIACARLLHTLGNTNLFDLPMRCPVAGRPGMFCAAQQFCKMMWPCFLGMHRRLFTARTVGRPVDSPPVDRAQRERLRLRLLAFSLEINYRDASPSLGVHLVPMHMQPGARELYQMRNTGPDVSDRTIVGDEMGDTIVADLNRRSRFAPSTCLREQLLPDLTLESPELQLCLHDVFVMCSSLYPGCDWAAHYSRFERVIDDDVQREQRMHPIVVHLFNHWQLMYNDRVYFFNSFVDSLWFWLCLMRQITDNDVFDGDYSAARRSKFFNELCDYVLNG